MNATRMPWRTVVRGRPDGRESRSSISPFLLAFLLIALSACVDAPAVPKPEPAYEPAQRDYGKVNAVWVYRAGTSLKAKPGTILVAADLHLPPPPDGKFDLDDIDIFDADTGENLGSDPYIQRLTLNGDFIDDDDPEVADQSEYRGVFVWMVPSHVKRVNFGYWGEMLYVKPVTLGSDPRVLPEREVKLVGLEQAGRASDAYDRFFAVLHARNSFRNFSPRYYTLVDSRGPKRGNVCECDALIELDERNHPLDIEINRRPYLVADRFFLVEYWCPSGVHPDSFNMLELHVPIPPARALDLPADARRAIAEAPREQDEVHRRK